MSLRRVVAILVALIVPVLVAGDSYAQSARPRNGTHVYLMRGFMGVFSPGMDELTAKLNRRGISASVHSHTAYASLASEAIANYKSGRARTVIIIGHSLGAGAAVDMAILLKEARVPVPLVVTFDPVSPAIVPSNVRRLVNLYVSNGMGTALNRGERSRGALVNLDQSRDPNMGHVSITLSPALHQKVMGYISAAIGSGGAAAAAPAGAAPHSAPHKQDGAAAPQAAPAAASVTTTANAPAAPQQDATAQPAATAAQPAATAAAPQADPAMQKRRKASMKSRSASGPATATDFNMH